MGRTKGTPNKRQTSEDIPLCLDYIPVCKKRKITRNKASPKYNVIFPNEQNKIFQLGSLLIGTTCNVFPENIQSCKATIKDLDDSSCIILEYDSTYVIIQPIIDTTFFRDLLSFKTFALKFYSQNDEVYAEIYFVSLPLPKFYWKIANTIKTLFKLLFNIETNAAEDGNGKNQLQSNTEIVKVYNKLVSMRDPNITEVNKDVQHPFLIPKLRPYQVEAVKWMLHRENNDIALEDSLHPLYIPVVLKSGITVYLDKCTGDVCREEPLINLTSKGGILADEMGLGKTVEMLACLLLNAKSNRMISYKDKVVDDNTRPVIEQQNKKRKIHYQDNTDNLDKLIKTKTDPTPTGGSRNRNKTANRISLEKWYNETLSEISTVNNSTKSTAPEGPLVQCICGNTSEENIIECEYCGKYQHPPCLGYKKTYGRYLCPQCWMDEPLIECGATLIVTPTTLRKQWSKEICKHIRGDLKVLVYKGNSYVPVYPTKMKEYDIVITTYNVLQDELKLTENIQRTNFRNQKRYSPPGSPLVKVKWWRLCLDEAQTIETPTKMVSEMASKITAHFRWAITGTPISNYISELYGLVDYLQIVPYNDINTWNFILYKPYLNGDDKAFFDFFSQVLWRTAKKDVLDQINIPNQTFKEHFLEFSAVEKYFYNREHDFTCNDFLFQAKKLHPSTSLKELNKPTLRKLLAPLLTLRQVCSHPNVSKGRYLTTKKPMSSMKDLLDALILKNTSDSEECLRHIIADLNGLAGVHLLMGDPEEAIDFYRQVLQYAARFSDDKSEKILTIDKLQMIHTMHNLAEVLEYHPPVAPTLRDSTLKQDCVELEEKYLQKFISETAPTYAAFVTLSNSIDALSDQFVLKPGQWYSDGLDQIFLNNHYAELLTRLDTACTNANIKINSRMISQRQMMKMILCWDDDIANLREKLVKSFGKLYEEDPGTNSILVKKSLVKKVADCHLRPSKTSRSKDKSKCEFCNTNEQLKQYETKVFSTCNKDFEVASWKCTKEEVILKSLLALLKAKDFDTYTKDGDTHIKIIESIKKEFKELGKFWTHLHEQVCAQDELDICKIRLQLKENLVEEESTIVNRNVKLLSNELENKNEKIHLLTVHELDYQNSHLGNQVKFYSAKLEKFLGTQSYLETLKKQQYENHNPEPCPICKCALEQQWCILLCGHSYCLGCTHIMVEQNLMERIQCSICRNKQSTQDISYIKLGCSDPEEENIKIVGNYSTKVEAITKLLLTLKSSNPEVKVLVFSSWLSVLKVLTKAFLDNNIKCELCKGSTEINKIGAFKNLEDKITALLLPVSLGSKGLNLIEATHVILTEPWLDPADELQAIGRVHRIGQTKSTVVHKFIIKNTIEENIHNSITADTEGWDKNKVTLQHLRNLFMSRSDEDESRTEIEVGENVGSTSISEPGTSENSTEEI